MFWSHSSVEANLFLRRPVYTVQIPFLRWWLFSASGSEMSSRGFAGVVTTFGIWKEWGCRPRNLDESSFPLDFWCDRGLSWLKWNAVPDYISTSWSVVLTVGEWMVAPAWADLYAAQPFLARLTWSPNYIHLLEREVFPVALLGYYHLFFCRFSSPKRFVFFFSEWRGMASISFFCPTLHVPCKS